MAAALNTVTIVGNVVDDPELRFTPAGQALATFKVAVSRRIQNQSGQWEDRTDGFFRCSCWRDMAENVAESLRKGTRVVVVGRLQQRSWEAQDGSKRWEVEIQVDEVGPSLRWSTAQVQKTQRSSGQPGGGDWAQRSGAPSSAPAAGAPSGSDWGTPTPAPVGGGDVAASGPIDEAGF